MYWSTRLGIYSKNFIDYSEPDILEQSYHSQLQKILNTVIIKNDKYIQLYNLNNKPNSLYKSLNKKIIHVQAALYFFENLSKINLNDGISEDTILSTIILELTQVDFADSFGERNYLRSYNSQERLYSGLKNNLLYMKSEGLFDYRNIPETDHKELKIFESFMYDLNSFFQGLTHRKKNWLILRQSLDIRITQYYKFIMYAHLKDTQSKNKLIEWFNRNQSKVNPYYALSISSSNDLWLNCYGDSISFLTINYIFHEYHNIDDLATLINNTLCAFLGVGILNVLMDSIVDVVEDERNNDPNLFSNIKKNGLYGVFSKDLNSNNITDLYCILISIIRDEFNKTMPSTKDTQIFQSLSTIVYDMTKFYASLNLRDGDPLNNIIFNNFLKLAREYKTDNT